MSAKQEASPAHLPRHIPGIKMVHLGGYGQSSRLVVHGKEGLAFVAVGGTALGQPAVSSR